MLKKILLLEDDLILGETIEELLEGEDYFVKWVRDGQIALDETFSNQFDLFLFDVNVPFISGFELLKDLRDSGDLTPAIFITANIDTSSLKKGFDAGGDDYIKKPFDFDELVIRIDSLLKKSFKNYNTTIIYQDLIYDTKKQLLYKDDEIIHITPSEIKILEYFFKNLDKPISKDELISQTHTFEEGSEGSLRVQISKLKKIGLKITNIRGVGYRCEKL